MPELESDDHLIMQRSYTAALGFHSGETSTVNAESLTGSRVDTMHRDRA